MASMKFAVGLELALLFLVCVAFPATASLPYLSPPPPAVPKVIAAEGVIYCKCNLTGYDKSTDAAPLPGVAVTLQCGNPKSTGVVVFDSVTNAGGYFFVQNLLPEKKMTKTCKVFVKSTPLTKCSVPPSLLGGIDVTFKKNMMEGPWKVALFTTGFVTLGPESSSKCY